MSCRSDATVSMVRRGLLGVSASSATGDTLAARSAIVWPTDCVKDLNGASEGGEWNVNKRLA